MRLDQRRNASGGLSETRHANGRTYQVRHQRTSEGGVILLQSDITNLKRAEALQLGRGRALEQLVADEPLSEVATTMLKALEEARPGFHGAVYLFSDETPSSLALMTAPTLPDSLTTADPGAHVGGRADRWPFAMTNLDGVDYAAPNLFDDAEWAPFADALVEAGVDACQAVPI